MIKKMLSEPRKRRTIILVILLIVSVGLLSPIFTRPGIHRRTLDVLDRNKNKATGLTLTVTVASTALSLLPDDTATPLAEELSDLSTPLMIITCILYFEQFMLTSLQFLSFSILVPAALLLLLASLYIDKKSLIILAKKLLLIALVCSLIVPFSASVTNLIENSFADSINAVDEKIAAVSEAFNQIIGGNSNGDILSFISNVATGIGSVFEFAKEALGMMIDAVAIMIITSCVIPIITAVLFLWCIKCILTGRMENIGDSAVDFVKKIPFAKIRSVFPNAHKEHKPSLPE